MEILNNIVSGFGVAITMINLLWCFIGVMLGTLVGVLPALGPLAAISILLPITYGMSDPITAIIFISGIYYGSQYGGSTTAILLKIPGEISSTVTTIDGNQMTQKGRGGAALAIAALASFFAGTVATLIIAVLAKPLSEVAFLFGAAEYAALMLLGLIAAVSLSCRSLLKGLAMVLIGILLGLVGADVNSGATRFTLGIPELTDGISFAILAMGVFGLGEIIYNTFHEKKIKAIIPSLKELYPSKQEIKQSAMPTLRGTFLGSILGLLPGGGAIMSSFVSYAVEKRISKNPQEFGRGAVAGVAAPEAANNAGAQTSFIPMLSLGIPTTPVMALIVAVLILHGIQPGPQVISNNANLFWGLIASMWIGNFMLLLLNLPLVGMWISVLRISWKMLYPIILLICVIGAYYINNNWFDVLLLVPFALLGYIFRLLDCEPAPLAMGFVVGALFEEYFRRALVISRGDWMVFLIRPLSLSFILIACILIITSLLLKYRKKQ
jgi:putative tricarboxylic transport membrane protein